MTSGGERCLECGGVVSTVTSIFGTNWKCEECGNVTAQRPSWICDGDSRNLRSSDRGEDR